MLQLLQFPSSVRGCLQCVTTHNVDNTIILVFFGRRGGFMVSVLVSGIERSRPALQPFPFLFFSGGEIEHKRKQTGERRSVPGVSKKLGESGGEVGWARRGSGSVARLTPFLCFLFFALSRSFVPFACFILEKLAKQARAVRVRAVSGNTVLCSLARHITLYSHSASLHPGVWMGTGELNAGGNPAMD